MACKRSQSFLVRTLISFAAVQCAATSLTVLSAEAFPLKPDPTLTPGDYCNLTDDDYSEDRYRERIPYCRRHVSRGLKARIYEAYGIAEHCRRLYTIDHLIPLSMGGSNDFENLWPEARALKRTRFDLETDTYEDLRDGKINRETAVETVLNAKLNPPTGVRIGGPKGCD